MEDFRKACGMGGLLRLDVRGADGEGARSLALNRPYAIIGSDPSADLRLDDARVSRRHAYLQAVSGARLLRRPGEPDRHPPRGRPPAGHRLAPRGRGRPGRPLRRPPLRRARGGRCRLGPGAGRAAEPPGRPPARRRPGGRLQRRRRPLRADLRQAPQAAHPGRRLARLPDQAPRPERLARSTAPCSARRKASGRSTSWAVGASASTAAGRARPASRRVTGSRSAAS